MGVNQNQNCSKMPVNCPTSRKKTFMTPNTIPKPIAKAIWIISTGIIPNTAQPGKFCVTSRNPRKRLKIITKLTPAFKTTINGRQMRGKLSFLIRLACSRKHGLATSYDLGKKTPGNDPRTQVNAVARVVVNPRQPSLHQLCKDHRIHNNSLKAG